MTTKEYKEFKGLKKENIRDNMNNFELVLNMLAEVTTTAISKQEKPDTFEKNKNVAKRGGGVAKGARNNIEQQLRKTIISPKNSISNSNGETKLISDIDKKE